MCRIVGKWNVSVCQELKTGSLAWVTIVLYDHWTWTPAAFASLIICLIPNELATEKFSSVCCLYLWSIMQSYVFLWRKYASNLHECEIIISPIHISCEYGNGNSTKSISKFQDCFTKWKLAYMQVQDVTGRAVSQMKKFNMTQTSNNALFQEV